VALGWGGGAPKGSSVMCEAMRCGALRSTALRRPRAYTLRMPRPQLPSSFGACFPARFSSRSCCCAPWADAAMKLWTLIRF
jgi:hypothetical protein